MTIEQQIKGWRDEAAKSEQEANTTKSAYYWCGRKEALRDALILLAEREIQIVIEPDDGEFHAFCSVLKGLHIDGRTQAETLEVATDAVAVHLASMVRHGESIFVGGEA